MRTIWRVKWEKVSLVKVVLVRRMQLLQSNLVTTFYNTVQFKLLQTRDKVSQGQSLEHQVILKWQVVSFLLLVLLGTLSTRIILAAVSEHFLGSFWLHRSIKVRLKDVCTWMDELCLPLQLPSSFGPSKCFQKFGCIVYRYIFSIYFYSFILYIYIYLSSFSCTSGSGNIWYSRASVLSWIQRELWLNHYIENPCMLWL